MLYSILFVTGTPAGTLYSLIVVDDDTVLYSIFVPCGTGTPAGTLYSLIVVDDDAVLYSIFAPCGTPAGTR